MRWIAVLAGSAAAVLAPAAGLAGDEGDVVRVPQDYEDVQEAVDAAEPGDTILIDAGVYPGDVIVQKHDLTIRGVDRNEVVFDGEDERTNAIEVDGADHVTIENMTAHNFTANGFYWEEADGFTGRYLTVWNVGLYGVYAIDSRDGLFEHSYVSGAADAAFYIGECRPCDTVLTDLTARYSSVGYSGTNASGGIVIKDSLWELNGTAIMTNSYNEEDFPPQGSALITGNTIRNSGMEPTPNTSPLGGFHGIGIAIAGGVENIVEGNTVTGSATYGIALYPTVQREGPPWAPEDNVIRDNIVEGSLVADIALSDGSGAGNCFADNSFGTSLPREIEEGFACGTETEADGDTSVAAELAIPIPEALDRLGERPDYTAMPEPGPQSNMPLDQESSQTLAASSDDGDDWAPWVVGAAIGFGLALAAVAGGWLLWRRGR
ncbi:MAG: right-handed parallel beta-helix repeat-containing protein [Dehalococcoidia bacterium]